MTFRRMELSERLSERIFQMNEKFEHQTVTLGLLYILAE
jgi:hypothetical protein